MLDREWTSVLDALPLPGERVEVVRHGIASQCFDIDEASLWITGNGEPWWDNLPPDGDGWWCYAHPINPHGGVLLWRPLAS